MLGMHFIHSYCDSNWKDNESVDSLNSSTDLMSGREVERIMQIFFSSHQVSPPKALSCPTKERNKDTNVMFFAEFSGFLCSRDGKEFF